MLFLGFRNKQTNNPTIFSKAIVITKSNIPAGKKKKMYFTCHFKKWLLNIETFHLIYFLLLHCRKNLIELYLGYSVIHKYYLSYKSYSDFYCSCLLQKSLSIFFAVETCNKMVITGKASHLAVKPTEK